MARYVKSLSLLNALISRLQANTGGERLLSYERIVENLPKLVTLSTASIVKEQQGQVVKKEEKKKQVQKKKKGEASNQAGKNQPQKPKLPEGADPDVLLFSEVDLRISQIVDCWKHPQSTYLYCQKILVGKELREIASGLQEHVPIQNMKGKVIVMANLKPKPVGGFVSNGMVVCSSDKEHKQFELLVPEGPLGQRLYLDGFEQLFTAGEQILPILKKKTLERCLDNFATDNEGYVIWKGIKLRSKAGFIKSSITNGSVD